MDFFLQGSAFLFPFPPLSLVAHLTHGEGPPTSPCRPSHPAPVPGAKGLPTTRRGPKGKVNGDVKGSGQLNSDLGTRQVGFVPNKRLRRCLPSQGCGVWPGPPYHPSVIQIGRFCCLLSSQHISGCSTLSPDEDLNKGGILLSCHQALFLIHICDPAWPMDS